MKLPDTDGMAAVLVHPETVLLADDWLPSACGLLTAYQEEHPAIGPDHLVYSARIWLIHLMRSLYGVKEHYLEPKLLHADLDVFWIQSDAPRRILYDRLAEIESAFRAVVAGACRKVTARKELRQAEVDQVDHCERVASMRRALPPGPVLPDGRFAEGPRDLTTDKPVKEVRLSDLVGDGWTAVVYQLMFHPDEEEACPMCSMWVDGLHGVSQHLIQRVNYALIAKAPLPKLRGWARHRGWDGPRLLSSFGTTFNADLGVEDPDGAQRPGLSVFVRSPEGVRHVYTTQASLTSTRSD